MRAALKAAGKKSEIHTYPDTPHAFHADCRPTDLSQGAGGGRLAAVAGVAQKTWCGVTRWSVTR